MTLDQLLFGVFPYVALVVAIIATTVRYLNKTFSFSSLSSQFLENRKLFWGSPPFHYGIIIILLGHFVAFLVPSGILAWNGVPWRLYILEAAALAFGLLALWGLIVLIIRRATDARVRAVTSPMDIVLLVVLLTQVATGVGTAISYRWGSSWYAASAAPYLWSVFRLHPDISLIENLPLLAKIHMVNASLIVLLLPFTRLVHFLSLPFQYFRRPHQVVIWNRKRM